MKAALFAGSVIVSLLASLGATSAAAQATYTCRDESGNSYTLSRPCPPGTRTTSASVGPSRQSGYSQQSSGYPQSNVRIPSAVEEPSHFQYMGARCRSLYAALRSNSGSAPDVVEGMRREYRRDCEAEERNASERMYSERRDSKRQALDQAKEQQAAVQADQERDTRRAQQCAESKRILAAKKARTDLSEGERADLRRFEENIATRCKL